MKTPKLTYHQLVAFAKFSKSQEYATIKGVLKGLIQSHLIRAIELNTAGFERDRAVHAEYRGRIFTLRMLMRMVEESGKKLEEVKEKESVKEKKK